MTKVTLAGTTASILTKYIEDENLYDYGWAQALLEADWRRCGNGAMVTAKMSAADHLALTSVMANIAADAIAARDFHRFGAV